jgi:hypothetical protein
MDGAWLVRARWRRRGAWLWPVFVAAVVADAAIGRALPPAGDSESLVAAGLLGLVLNLLGVLLCSRPLGALIRKVRPDLPGVVARDYAGTTTVALITTGLLIAGLAHRSTVQAAQNAMRDASARAQAFIGDRAPAEFRRNVEHLDMFTISSGIYRACVPTADGSQTYCVIVDRRLPFSRSVSFAGYEPNSVFAEGVP